MPGALLAHSKCSLNCSGERFPGVTQEHWEPAEMCQEGLGLANKGGLAFEAISRWPPPSSSCVFPHDLPFPPSVFSHGQLFRPHHIPANSCLHIFAHAFPPPRVSFPSLCKHRLSFEVQLRSTFFPEVSRVCLWVAESRTGWELFALCIPGPQVGATETLSTEYGEHPYPLLPFPSCTGVAHLLQLNQYCYTLLN